MHSGRIFIKSLSFILLLCILTVGTLGLTSCNRSYDSDEVIEAAEELLKKAEVLNEIYYGDGIAVMKPGHSNGAYYQADPTHLYILGIETLADLVVMTESTFSKRYSLSLFNSTLSMVHDGDNIVTMARYYQKYEDDLDTQDPVCIMVYEAYEPLFTSDMTFDYSTLCDIGANGDYVNLTVEAEVMDRDGRVQRATVELSLIEESSGWRIDNPTWVNYNPYADTDI